MNIFRLFMVVTFGVLLSVCFMAGCEGIDVAGSGGESDSDTDTDSDTGNAGHVLEGISIEPANFIFEVDLNAPATMPYQCIGYFADGVNEDITSQVTWDMDNAALGDFGGDATLDIPAITSVGAQMGKVSATYSDDFQTHAQLTVVSYQMTGPNQDFFFQLPYNDQGGPQEKPLDFSTDVQDADIFFAMDTTGSMGGTISSLQASLSGTIIPGIQAQMATAWFGVGGYDDFPISPYGSASTDQPFYILQEITGVAADVQAGVNALSLHSGADGAESLIEALFQISTGYGISAPPPTLVPPNTSGVGGVGFRNNSMPIIVPLTDIYSHNGINPAYDYTGDVAAVAATRADSVIALNSICARVVGVAATNGDPDMVAMAEDTGALIPPEAWGPAASRPPGCAVGMCCTGTSGAGRATNAAGLCPLAYIHSGGTGLGDTIVTGIEMLTHYAAFDCNTETTGETADVDGNALPAGTTTADFIVSIVPISFVVPVDPPGLPTPTITTDGFDNVTPGTVVTFDVTAFNDFVVQTDDPQFFEATITVFAGGCFPLDDRVVLILVPPNPIDVS